MERESCVIFLKENNTGNYCLHDKEIAQETNLTEKLHIGCKIFLYFFFQNCQRVLAKFISGLKLEMTCILVLP